MKRQQQQDSIDPSSRIDSDLFKDPLKQRESEHEQEWKFRQVCVSVSLRIGFLGLGALTARGQGSIPGWGTKSLQATQHGQRKKRLIFIACLIYDPHSSWSQAYGR